jgi:hypothetical protein
MLQLIVNKYTDNNKINIQSDNNIDEIFVNDPKSNVVLIYKNLLSYDENIVKSINEYIGKNKIVINIVKLNFNFNLLVKEIRANSIDVFSWRGKDGVKLEEYIIVISNIG